MNKIYSNPEIDIYKNGAQAFFTSTEKSFNNVMTQNPAYKLNYYNGFEEFYESDVFMPIDNYAKQIKQIWDRGVGGNVELLAKEAIKQITSIVVMSALNSVNMYSSKLLFANINKAKNWVGETVQKGVNVLTSPLSKTSEEIIGYDGYVRYLDKDTSKPIKNISGWVEMFINSVNNSESINSKNIIQKSEIDGYTNGLVGVPKGNLEKTEALTESLLYDEINFKKAYADKRKQSLNIRIKDLEELDFNKNNKNVIQTSDLTEKGIYNNTDGNLLINRGFNEYPSVPPGRNKFNRTFDNEIMDNLNAVNVIDGDEDTNINTFKNVDFVPFYIYDIYNKKYLFFRNTIMGTNDSTGVSWDEGRTPGRPDPYYNYVGVDKNQNISFSIVANSLGELEGIFNKVDYLQGLCYPTFENGNPTAPFIRITIGNFIKDQLVKINSLFVNPDDSEMGWNLVLNNENGEKFQKLPFKLDITMDYTIIFEELPENKNKEDFKKYNDNIIKWEYKE